MSEEMTGSLPSPLCINDVLSHHLLIEVLIRIPLNDAFRSRSVCKLWLSTLRDDPHFVAGFVHHRISGLKSDDDHQQQLMNVQWHQSEMLLVKSSETALMLDFLPFHDESTSPHPSNSTQEIIGSSNGLILFSPVKTLPVQYYICNPLTKQWLKLPYAPNCHLPDVQVGFVCDPFYLIDSGNHSVALNYEFSMKVVRLHYRLVNAESNHLETMDVEVFDSKQGIWTISKVQLPAGGVPFKSDPGPLVPYKGRLYWLVEHCDFLIYDPEKNEFLLERHDPPSESLYIFGYWFRKLAEFKGLSLCRGSFWIGQAWNSRLKVFILTDDGKWRVKHDVNLYNEMEWERSSRTVRQNLRFCPESVVFWFMHPDDSMVAYLTLDNAILECDFRSKTIKVMFHRLPEYLGWSNVVAYSLPLWPTPLPAIPAI
ncbi:hypothetical protein LINGRAHAP2_LOCUS36464 [Linum grandiflorum]